MLVGNVLEWVVVEQNGYDWLSGWLCGWLSSLLCGWLFGW